MVTNHSVDEHVIQLACLLALKRCEGILINWMVANHSVKRRYITEDILKPSQNTAHHLQTLSISMKVNRERTLLQIPTARFEDGAATVTNERSYKVRMTGSSTVSQLATVSLT